MGLLRDVLRGELPLEALAAPSKHPCSRCGGPITLAEERDALCAGCFDAMIAESAAEKRQQYLDSFADSCGVEARYSAFTLRSWRGGLPAKSAAWMERARAKQTTGSLVLYGPNGSGKTHLAIGILRSLYENNQGMKPVFAFLPMPIFVDRITAEWGKPDRPFSDWACSASVAVLDDLSRNPGENRLADEAVWSLIYRRHAAALPSIITTNRDPREQLKKDPPTWSRILDGAVIQKLDPGVDRRVVPYSESEEQR